MKKTWVSDVVWLVCLTLFLVGMRAFIFSPIKVQGESMMPNLVDGEKAIALKVGEIKRFDVIPLKAPDDPELYYVKRVIGLPGDTVEYKEDQLIVNGKPLKEDYLNQYKKEFHEAGNTGPLTEDFTLQNLTGQQTVPENTYFVLGDNRQVSKDSRFPEVGFIPKDNVIGKATVSFWPPSQWGMVK
ncbi:MAG: signal peptidase I [Vagococcus sp.]|uniref:signal peptidase I n=1 Tax=Vagococcus sp. TaxID=1933889 RepID=UPI002FC83362